MRFRVKCLKSCDGTNPYLPPCILSTNPPQIKRTWNGAYIADNSDDLMVSIPYIHKGVQEGRWDELRKIQTHRTAPVLLIVLFFFHRHIGGFTPCVSFEGSTT